MTATMVAEAETSAEADLREQLLAANNQITALTTRIREFETYAVTPADHVAVRSRAGRLAWAISTAIGLIRRTDPTDWAAYPMQLVEIRGLLEEAVR